MVTTTPSKIVDFVGDAQQRESTLHTFEERSRAYFDAAVGAAREHPLAAAAVGVGVVAAAAAGAYGVARLAGRNASGTHMEDAEDSEQIVEPQAVIDTI